MHYLTFSKANEERIGNFLLVHVPPRWVGQAGGGGGGGGPEAGEAGATHTPAPRPSFLLCRISKARQQSQNFTFTLTFYSLQDSPGARNPAHTCCDTSLSLKVGVQKPTLACGQDPPVGCLFKVSH